MLNYLDHLRRQPLQKRKQIALMVAGGGTFLIILFWAAALFSREPAPTVATVDKKGPIETMGETIGTLFSDASTVVASIRGIFTSTLETHTATSTMPAEEAENE